jgi:glycerol-3-phosphate acyltransferase PlsY
MRALLAVLAAYVAGSVPWAYVAGRVLKGIDLRKHGSGNLGATNVYRTLGAPAAVAVLALDAAKGAVPVLCFPNWFGSPPGAWAIACGLAAIGGHVFPVFLLGRGGGGGKGVATAAGAFGALAPAALATAAAAFVVVVAATRYISLGSMTGAAVLPLAVLVTRGARDPLFAATLGIGAFVFWRHRENLARLRRGEEPRFVARRPD